MKPRVIVIGSTNTDMVISVPHLPEPGETVLGGRFHMVNGGKGANQAIAAARAGGDVGFLTCVGDDAFGKNACDLFKQEGIDTSYIKIVEKEPSGVAMINVSENGENSISVAPGANSLLLPEDIKKAESFISKADIVLLQLEIPIQTVYSSIRIAVENKVPVILNPAPAQRIDPEILRMIDYITPNKNEAVAIANLGKSMRYNEDLILELKRNGLKTVIITLGERGVLFTENGQVGHQDGHKVEVIDTTAAGDTFNGYLAVSLARGETLDQAIRIANQAASLSVTRLGASTSIPFLNELI